MIRCPECKNPVIKIRLGTNLRWVHSPFKCIKNDGLMINIEITDELALQEFQDYILNYLTPKTLFGKIILHFKEKRWRG